MKPIHIFSPGRHTPMAGGTLSFSEADLAAAAAAYDPALHEAPIVVGHPKDNLPAYGWVRSVAFSESAGLTAEPHQVDPAFAELVAASRFKKVSASFYTPDSPANPKPGVYYLRHVGFLGAQPPAVKGLRPVEFAEAEEGVVEFGDWADRLSASMWRRLREWVLAQFGQEAADTAIPSYSVDSLQEDALRPESDVAANSNHLGFSEGDPVSKPEDLAALAAQRAGLEAREAALKKREDAVTTKEASFAERDAELAKIEKARRKGEIESFVGDLVKAGQVLPKDQARVVAFMEALPESAKVVEFAEGANGATETPAMQVFKDFLKGLPKQVEFSERARGEPGKAVDANDGNAIAKAALDFQEAERKAGRSVSIEIATQHVVDNLAG